MNIPPVDLPYLREQLLDLANQVREQWEISSLASSAGDSPLLLRDALRQLIGILEHLQDDWELSDRDTLEVTTLGAYGLHLLEETIEIARKLERADLSAEIEQLCLPFALWIARRGGEIRTLVGVVNGLALIANRAGTTQEMAILYGHCCELIEATSPACEERIASDMSHPWRMLLLNRAIVATRSHNPELMQVAFDAIVECLPAEARRFFSEGMEQIAVIDYPEPVRAVIRQYYLSHAIPDRLH